jgi:hypothetical protein
MSGFPGQPWLVLVFFLRGFAEPTYSSLGKLLLRAGWIERKELLIATLNSGRDVLVGDRLSAMYGHSLLI